MNLSDRLKGAWGLRPQRVQGSALQSLPPPIGIKICGLCDAQGFDAAITNGADWAGFVFFARSPRAVTPRQAALLSARHPGAITRIGLFVRPDDAQIARCLDQVRLDGLQIYDDATRADAIRARFGLPVWLACGVAGAADLPARSLADRLVIEGRAPPDADRPGGNGVRFDWTILQGWSAPRPWILAGGLDAGNVAEAIARSGASCVDVSSGVEFAPGVKDPARIAAFIQAARSPALSGASDA